MLICECIYHVWGQTYWSRGEYVMVCYLAYICVSVILDKNMFYLEKENLMFVFCKNLLICLINFTYAVALVLEMSQFAQSTLF